MGEDKGCIFCKIISGEIPASKIYEDADVLAFMELFPVNKGHVLVIPKKHVDKVYDIPDEVLQKFIIVAKDICNSQKEVLGCRKVIMETWGEDVRHAHMHLIPSFENDGLKFFDQGKYEDDEIEKYKEKIKNSFLSSTS